MQQFELAAKGTRLVLKENVLAVFSDVLLKTVSSAIHNGGSAETRAIVNAQVTEEYGDKLLHEDPKAFVLQSAGKLRLTEDFVGMVTFAAVKDFALSSKREDDLGVSVVATAGCTHAESAGEKIEVQKIEGTVNIIVLIDGNPTDGCLTSAIITATEAKTAALRELDLRSRYSGDEATGTITDAMVVAATGKGAPIVYSGPASKLGQLVGFCTRKAVREAVMKGKVGGCVLSRSIADRLAERHLPVEKLAHELAKVISLGADEETLAASLAKIMSDPASASAVLAAAKMDEDYAKGLLPPEVSNADVLGQFGGLLVKQATRDADSSSIDLQPFLKQVLIGLLEQALRKAKTGNLK